MKLDKYTGFIQVPPGQAKTGPFIIFLCLTDDFTRQWIAFG